jgi:PKHD-type hydroxylase
VVVIVPKVLDGEALAQCRSKLATATWVDGRGTARGPAAKVKDNLQLAEDDPLRAELGAVVLGGLERSQFFMTTVLPLKIVPPGFNRYEGGQTYGDHVDIAVRFVRSAGQHLRTDLSATLFLSDPGEYDGGELTVRESAATFQAKLPAGDMIVYPAGTVHHVNPVSRGVRLAAFFWIQSIVRDDADRALLQELHLATKRVMAALPDDPAVVQLVGVYQNLMRRWGDT